MRAPLRAVGPVLLVLTGACTTEPDPLPAGSEMVQSQRPPAARDVTGEYRVSFVNGAKPVIGLANSEPLVTVGAERIHFQSQCVYADWTYTVEGEAFAAKDYYEPGSTMCERALAPGEVAIQEALDAARVVRSIRSGLYLEGGGHTLQLERVPSAAEKAARAVDLTGRWQVVTIDGRTAPAIAPIELMADFEQIWWEPECALQYRPYAITGTRFRATQIGEEGGPVCDIAPPEELPKIWSALEAGNEVERTASGRVTIRGGGRSVVLQTKANGE